MSSLQQEQQPDQAAIATAAANGDGGNIFYPKIGCASTTTTSQPTHLIDQTLYENYKLKWEEASLVQKMAALKLEAQRQLFDEFMIQKAQLQNAQLSYSSGIHLRTAKPASQRNRELYKTALCDFWSAGVPCRFGERCWFAHGPHELRIARFVYPSLNPYDYEIRMSGPRTVNTIAQCTPSPTARRLWNLEQSYPMVPSTALATRTATSIPENVPSNAPIGFERKLCGKTTSPVQENVQYWSAGNAGRHDDSGIASLDTMNSPEAIAKAREAVDGANYHGIPPFAHPFSNEAFNSNIVPPHLQQPLNTLTSEQANFAKSEPYSRWLSTGTVYSANLQIAPDLEQLGWWPDTVNNTYPSSTVSAMHNLSQKINIQPNAVAGSDTEH